MTREPGPTLVLRSHAARALGVAMIVAAVGGLLIVATAGSAAVLRYAGALALFGLVGWAAYWRPCVQVSDAGVRVTNTWRTVNVPWPALDAVEGRYGLRLLTSDGPVNAWSVPAPSGRSRRGEAGSSEEAVLVAQRLESLRVAGALRVSTLDRPAVATQLHLRDLVAAGLILVAAVALPFLA